MAFPSWMKDALRVAQRKKIGTQPGIGEDTDTQEYQIPASPFPGMTLAGVLFEGLTDITFGAAEAPIADTTMIDLSVGDVDVRQTSDNKGSRIQSPGNAQRLSEYLRLVEAQQDAPPTAQGAGPDAGHWNLFVPFCGIGQCTVKMRTGLIANVYAADVTAIAVSFTVYAVYVPASAIAENYRMVVRETNIPAMTEGNVSTYLNALENCALHGLLFNISALSSAGADRLTRIGYSDGVVAFDDNAQTVYADNDAQLGDPVDLPRTAGCFYYPLLGRPYKRDGSVFINPEYSAATAMNVLCVQSL